jgi:hypothetical protein
MYRELEKKDGNTNADIVPAPGTQMRVALFHDTKREGDNFELHDASDDIYYVLEGKATLYLGGTCPNRRRYRPVNGEARPRRAVSRSRSRKGDLIIVRAERFTSERLPAKAFR